MGLKLITLSALKPFFFGRANVYSNSNYVQSEYFAQQTQLLGAIRAYLLESNNLLKVHKYGKYCAKEVAEKAKKLAGTANSSTFETNDDLGIINYLSPMFVVKKEDNKIIDALFQIPSNISQFSSNKAPEPCSEEESKEQEILKIARPLHIKDAISNNKAVVLDNYSQKNGFKSALGGKAFWDVYINSDENFDITGYDEVFQSCEQVGIGLDNKKAIDGQFYTKTSYMLQNGYELAFFIDIDDVKLRDLELKFENGFLTMGADTSTFKLTVHSSFPASFEDHKVIKALTTKEQSSGNTIVLLSDAMLTSSIDDAALFQIVPYKVTHRMYEQKSKKMENSYVREVTSSKSSTKLLVPNGSIYFYESPKQLQQAKGAYLKMGYNKYLAI